jgi:hypothetical protein
MHLRVIYSDDRHDIVPDFVLESLIRSHKVKKFYRYSELKWVTIGIDPVRGERRRSGYDGTDRRRNLSPLSALA